MTDTLSPSRADTKSQRVQVGTEVLSNPLAFLMARNNRMARAMDESPAVQPVMAKLFRAYDYFCLRNHLHTPEQRRRVTVDVTYNDATDTALFHFEVA